MTDPITFRDLLRLMAKGFAFKFGNSPAAEQVEDALRRAADTIDGLRDRVVMAESYAKGFENARLDLVNERNELGRRLALADAVVEAHDWHPDMGRCICGPHTAYRAEVQP